VRYHVLVNGHHHPVDVERDGGGWRATLGEGSMRIDIGVLVDGEAYTLICDGRSVDVAVEERGQALELLVSGRRYSTEVLGEREWQARSIQPEDAAGDKLVRAAMTGVVREVLVSPGDAVAKGQTLLILEAMKMENEVKAEAAGQVARLVATAGQAVTMGDVLAEIA
jgi:biotin carboxyl carrier protein